MLDPRLSDPQLPVWGMQHLNYQQKHEHGVLGWHRQGFTGKGVKVAVIDGKCPPTLEPMYGRVRSPLPWNRGPASHANIDNHGQFVTGTLLEFAPDAEIVTLPYWNESAGSTVDVLEASIAYCIDHDIKIIASSTQGSSRRIVSDMTSLAASKGILLITSAGNEGSGGFDPNDPGGTQTITLMARNPDWIAVANLRFPDYPEGQYGDPLVRATSSSVGPNMFTSCIGGYVAPRFAEDGVIRGITGTSFACPALAGMMACYVQRYREVFGNDPDQQTMRTFIQWNSSMRGNWEESDWLFENGGRSYGYGYGFFKLPTGIDI